MTKIYRVSPVGFMSIAFFLFFLEQTDVLKQTHIVITDHQVAETLYGIKAHISMKHRQ
jgi:hypothetical protein